MRHGGVAGAHVEDVTGVHGVSLEHLGRIYGPEGDGSVGVAQSEAVASYPGEGCDFDIVVVGEAERCNWRVDPFYKGVRNT